MNFVKVQRHSFSTGICILPNWVHILFIVLFETDPKISVNFSLNFLIISFVDVYCVCLKPDPGMWNKTHVEYDEDLWNYIYCNSIAVWKTAIMLQLKDHSCITINECRVFTINLGEESSFIACTFTLHSFLNSLQFIHIIEEEMFISLHVELFSDRPAL
jgi:hypothetical protein